MKPFKTRDLLLLSAEYLILKHLQECKYLVKQTVYKSTQNEIERYLPVKDQIFLLFVYLRLRAKPFLKSETQTRKNNIVMLGY